MIIVRALYGLEISGSALRSKLSETLKSLWYKSSKADADLWMKQDFMLNAYPYYKYMLLHFDDFLHIGFNPKEYMDALNPIFRLIKGFETFPAVGLNIPMQFIMTYGGIFDVLFGHPRNSNNVVIF